MTDIIQALNKEISEITLQIERLESYRKTLVAAVEANLSISGTGVPLKPAQAGNAEVSDYPTEGNFLPPYPQRGNQPNTLEMVKTVLKNAKGEEKTPDELRHLIRNTFGVDPAKSLDQMLYKRSAKGTVFYKTPNGRFGLLELKEKIDQSNASPMLLALDSAEEFTGEEPTADS